MGGVSGDENRGLGVLCRYVKYVRFPEILFRGHFRKRITAYVKQAALAVAA